jgi:hypothetical protein
VELAERVVDPSEARCVPGSGGVDVDIIGHETLVNARSSPLDGSEEFDVLAGLYDRNELAAGLI